jgi:hypothetical protein
VTPQELAVAVAGVLGEHASPAIMIVIAGCASLTATAVLWRHLAPGGQVTERLTEAADWETRFALLDGVFMRAAAGGPPSGPGARRGVEPTRSRPRRSRHQRTRRGHRLE